MAHLLDAGCSANYPPEVVLQVLLANNLTSFTEFAFGVVRPGVIARFRATVLMVPHKSYRF